MPTPIGNNFGVRQAPAAVGLRAPEIVKAPERDRQWHMRDFANAPGLELPQLEVYLQDMREEPAWRAEADIDADYYDGNQLPAEVAQALRDKGMGPLITELVKPTVNAVLGMEAMNRVDWRVQADSEEQTDVAEALSAKLHESERETRADRACADAYAGEIKVGLHWVEVSRTSDPFAYPYRVRAVHRREIYWDHRSREPDLSDARYLVRKRWLDEDQAMAFFPAHAELVKHASRGWLDWTDNVMRDSYAPMLQHSFEQERRFAIDEAEWRDTARGRMVAYEVWYRVWVRGTVLRARDGRVVEYDPTNRFHKLAIAHGGAEPIYSVYPKMRLSWWLGPHRITDAPVRRNEFPYVPFWGYREDRTMTPYGIVRAMRSPQDEINARYQKMMWLLSARRVIADSDAIHTEFNSWSKVLQELNRPDAVVVLNAGRANKDAFRVEENMQLADAQFKVIEERKRAVQEAAGVYPAMMGDKGGADSGVAINALIQQGTAALAELNDNYRFSRRKVGELLLNYLREDLSGKPAEFEIDNDYGGKRKVQINVPSKDSMGNDIFINDVAKAQVKVALADVPSSQSYREQQFKTIGEAIKAMPPEAQAIMVPIWMEFSDLPNRKLIAKQLRGAFGMDTGEPPTPEQAQAAEQQAAAAAQIETLNIEGLAADVEAKKAAVRKANLEADQMQAQLQAAGGDQMIGAQIEAVRAEYEKQVNDLTGQIAALRTANAVKLRELNVKAADNQAKTDADVQIARLRADADTQIAQIEARRDAADEALRRQLEALSQKIEAVSQKAKERPAAGARTVQIKRADGTSFTAVVSAPKPESRMTKPPARYVPPPQRSAA